MKTNKIAIIISLIAVLAFALAALAWPVHTAMFEASVLLLSLAFASFYYSLLRRVYGW